jgi:enoyl-CoA hydratase
MPMFVSVDRSDAVAVLRVDRPPANAIDVELLGELVSELERIAADPPPALILGGREGFFSAGVDLKLVPTYGPDEHRYMVAGINRMVIACYGLPCPVIAAVTGHAIAGGLVLALCADHRVASLRGSYGLTVVKVGVPYPQAALGVVRAELPAHAARTLVLGNRLFDAGECVRLGVFDEAVDAALVQARALEVAREMVLFPQHVYAQTKQALRAAELERMRVAADADPLLDAWVSSQPSS